MNISLYSSPNIDQYCCSVDNIIPSSNEQLIQSHAPEIMQSPSSQSQIITNINHTSNITSVINSTSDSGDSSGASTGKWAGRLLRECARAISDKDSTRIHHLLWTLNELASPYGDTDQKLASHFLQALFCKATESGDRCFRTLSAAAEKGHSFESARKTILKFQEASPWTTFGHVAANGAILEAMEGETRLHIVDISNTYCTQWPTLLEALATKNTSDETPSLRLTAVVTSPAAAVTREIGRRMEKFARLMGVPFEFHVAVVARWDRLTQEELGVRDQAGEAVAVNCVGALRRVAPEARGEVLMATLRGLRPKVVTVVEEEADFTSTREDFVKCFEECLRFYGLFFEMLEESFVPTSHERLMLERECSRSIVRVLACEDDDHSDDIDHLEHNDQGASTGTSTTTTTTTSTNNDQDHDQYLYSCERREKGRQWCAKLKEGGFSPFGLSEDAVDDVKSLLKRYKAGWSFVKAEGGNYEDQSGLYLLWKDEPVVWASAWKPST